MGYSPYVAAGKWSSPNGGNWLYRQSDSRLSFEVYKCSDSVSGAFGLSEIWARCPESSASFVIVKKTEAEQDECEAHIEKSRNETGKNKQKSNMSTN